MSKVSRSFGSTVLLYQATHSPKLPRAFRKSGKRLFARFLKRTRVLDLIDQTGNYILHLWVAVTNKPNQVVFREAYTDNSWYSGHVPGCVHTDLLTGDIPSVDFDSVLPYVGSKLAAFLYPHI